MLGLRRWLRGAGDLSGPLVPGAAAAGVAGWLLVRHGVSLVEVVRYAGYLVLVLAVPGRLLWERVTRAWESDRPGGRLELWTCGVATGLVLELVAYPLARWAGVPAWYPVLTAAVAVALLPGSLRRRATRVAAPEAQPRPGRPGQGAGAAWTLAGVVGFLAWFLERSVYERYDLDRFRLVDVDETFHLALVGELRHHFPPVYPYVEAGDLTYQWFPHLHMAASTWVTGLEPLAVYRRFDVLVLSTLAVLGTAVVATHLAGRSWPGAVAAGILVLVGSFDVTGTVVGRSVAEDRFLEPRLLLHSPTQTMAFALAPPVMLLCLRLLERTGATAGCERGHGATPGAVHGAAVWVALGAGLVALTGTKVTFVPIFACGLLAAAGVAALGGRGREAARAVTAVAVCGSVVALGGAILYRGDTQSLVWGPGRTAGWFAEQLGLAGGGLLLGAAVTLALLAGWLASAAGATGLLLTRARKDPRTWFLLGSAAAGLGATFLLFHGGMSQLYFGRSTAPVLAVASAWGLAELLAGHSRRVHVAAAAAAASGGVVLLAVRSVTESAPELPFWVNGPALLGAVLVAALGLGLARDLSGGRVTVPLALPVAVLVGLGLARALAFVLGHQAAQDVGEVGEPLGRDAVSTARALRALSAPEDRVITNAHCLEVRSEAAGCDSRHFWLSGFAERRFVLEGWAYTRFGESWAEPFWGDPELMARNDRLFTEPSAERLSDFVRDHPASWLVVDRSLEVDFEALRRTTGLVLVLERGRYALFEIAT